MFNAVVADGNGMPVTISAEEALRRLENTIRASLTEFADSMRNQSESP